MRLFFTLAGAALMTVGLSGCTGGAIDEGIEPNVDMTKSYPPPAKADFGSMGRGAGPKKQAKAAASKADAAAPKADPGGG